MGKDGKGGTETRGGETGGGGGMLLPFHLAGADPTTSTTPPRPSTRLRPVAPNRHASDEKPDGQSHHELLMRVVQTK